MTSNHTNYSIKAKPIFNQDSQFKRPLGFFEKDELLISAKGIACIYSRTEVAPKFADANFEKENQSLVFNKELAPWKVGGGTESISSYGGLVHRSGKVQSDEYSLFNVQTRNSEKKQFLLNLSSM